MRRFNRKAVLTAACIGLVGPSVFAADFPEVEPNSTKATANVATLAVGDSVSGITTGTTVSSTAPASTGLTSVDYFDITTDAAPTAGIWRYRLTLTTTGTAGHTGTLRGVSQTAGVLGAFTTDAAPQTSSATTTPARINQWYANGNPTRVMYRVAGGAATTATYNATMTRTPVTPTVVPGTVAAGSVVISTQGVTTVDTEFWLYDSNFVAIANAGNDDESIAGGGPGTTLQSRLTRTLTPGDYILAISTSGLANNLPAPTDDDFRSGSCLDFPNALSSSSSSSAATDLDFNIISSAGTIPVTASRTESYGILFYQFTVAATANPTVAFCTATPSATVLQGGSVTLSTNVTWAGTPGTVTADLTAFGLTDNEPLTDAGFGNYLINVSVPGAQPLGATSVTLTATNPAPGLETGTCSIPLTIIAPPPANDLCSGSITIPNTSFPVTVTGNNFSATTVGDRTSTCISVKQSVWYDFTAPNAGTYIFDTETSAQADTVLTAFVDCDPAAAQLACDDEGGTGSLSRMSLVMTAGQNIKVMLSTWASATAGGFALNVSFIPPPCVTFTTQPVADSECVGTTLSYSAVATVLTGTPAYQWQTAPVSAGPWTNLTDEEINDLGVVTGATASSITIENAALAANGTRIRVVVTGDCGTGNSTDVAIGVINCLPNDACSGALPAIVGTTAGNNATANNAGDVVPTCQTLSGKGLWYTFTAGANGGTYLIDTEGSTQSDTVLSVYDACGGAQIACDDDSGTVNLSRLTVTLTPNQEIKIQVRSFGSAPAGGAFNLNIAECTLIATQPIDVSIAPGATAGFIVGATGPGTLTYVWERQLLGAGPFTAVTDGVVAGLGTVSGATTASLSIANAEAAASTDKFRCVVTSSCNSATTSEATLTVANPYPARCNGADIAYDSGDFLPRAEIVDGTNGTPEIIGPFTGDNNGVTEADYNVFFANFFDAVSVCDVANDDGSSRVPTPAPGIVTNNGVTEGDYNYFFGVFFDGCAF